MRAHYQGADAKGRRRALVSDTWLKTLIKIHLAPATETLAKDIEQIKQIAANNNAILREVLKTMKDMQKSGGIAPAQASLFEQALQPMEL